MTALKVPDWLTADFLKSCLESDNANFSNIVLKTHKFEPVVAAGNNYGSLLLRVIINYKNPCSSDQIISLIIKAPLLEGHIDKLNELFPEFYQKEPIYYREFVEETYKLIKHDIVPKSYRTPNPLCVALEDLSSSGFVMVDRHKLLDFDHCKLYIEASAKLHALSIAVNKTHPEVIAALTKETPEMKEKFQESVKGMIELCIKCMALYLEDKPECEKYLKLIKQLAVKDNFWKMYLEMEECEPPLRAMIQNDPWCTNMMFKYDASGKVKKIKIIDFQGMRLTSPVLELLTFVWVSVNPEVRESKLNDLYHLYCDSFNANLEEIGCPERLPFEVLKQELVRLSPQAFGITCFMMPLCVADGAADMNALFSESCTTVSLKESSIYKLYVGNTFSKYSLQIMMQLEREGVFDFMKGKIRTWEA